MLDARQIMDDLIPMSRLEEDVLYRGYSIRDVIPKESLQLSARCWMLEFLMEHG